MLDAAGVEDGAQGHNSANGEKEAGGLGKGAERGVVAGELQANGEVGVVLRHVVERFVLVMGRAKGGASCGRR